MKHALLGVGGVGGLVGAALASMGEDVSVLVRSEKLGTYPASLSVERPSGAINASAKAAAALVEPVDVLWIATKTYQLETALQVVRSFPRCIIPLLNGVDHVEALRARFGHDRVLPATIAVEAEKIAPGRFVQRSPFANLNLSARGEPLLRGIVARLRDVGFSCGFIANEQTLLWRKLCFIGPFALVTSASGLDKGQIYVDASWKRKLTSAFGEACVVAKASGAEVDLAELQAVVDKLPAGIRSSMQKDLAAGRPLELDALGGPIARGGQRHSIDVSTTDSLIAAIRARAAE